MNYECSRLNADALATDQTLFSAICFLGAGLWATANETRGSGCVFRPRANRTKNIDHATVAGATTSGINAVSIVAGHDTFSFALRAAKTAALTRRAFRIFLANNGLIGDPGRQMLRRTNAKLAIEMLGKVVRDKPQARPGYQSLNFLIGSVAKAF